MNLVTNVGLCILVCWECWVRSWIFLMWVAENLLILLLFSIRSCSSLRILLRFLKIGLKTEEQTCRVFIVVVGRNFRIFGVFVSWNRGLLCLIAIYAWMTEHSGVKMGIFGSKISGKIEKNFLVLEVDDDLASAEQVLHALSCFSKSAVPSMKCLIRSANKFARKRSRFCEIFLAESA